MEDNYRSYLKGIRVSPRKARLVVNLIRGKHVQDALDTLRFTQKKTAPVVAKMIRAAISNATAQATVDVDNLIVSKACVDEGPMFRRYIPRAQGRAAPVRKRSSHITVELSELR
ncbi:MAG: 50S ribosomal protein L22 [Deltaproteobacteria bacterium]|nr:50S ribosomal protein L22 [Deltaproteobacteria bacterium]